MSKKISQNTFDDVVRENILEFEMEVQEAMTDAVEQFNAQVCYIHIFVLIFYRYPF